jgi:hypothetical protein
MSSSSVTNYVLIGPAIGVIEHHTLPIDQTAQDLMTSIKGTMGVPFSSALSVFKVAGLEGELIALDDSLFHFELPINDWAPPVRGAMVYIGPGLQDFSSLSPPSQTTTNAAEAMFTLLARRRDVLKKDLQGPSFTMSVLQSMGPAGLQTPASDCLVSDYTLGDEIREATHLANVRMRQRYTNEGDSGSGEVGVKKQ